MVRCGSWRNGRFQGERMVYTADRVYGIDLSRHQHEKAAAEGLKSMASTGATYASAALAMVVGCKVR